MMRTNYAHMPEEILLRMTVSLLMSNVESFRNNENKENFATDLELFAKHGKRTTVNTDDVKLLARRSKALLNFITEKCNDLACNNAEQKEKRALTTGKGKKKPDDHLEPTVTESEDATID
ncbi:centromere protein S isoform X2 [Cetorhinus maximus]